MVWYSTCEEGTEDLDEGVDGPVPVADRLCEDYRCEMRRYPVDTTNCLQDLVEVYPEEVPWDV